MVVSQTRKANRAERVSEKTRTPRSITELQRSRCAVKIFGLRSCTPLACPSSQLRSPILKLLTASSEKSFSSDGGLTWSGPAKTKFDASSSPAILKRLASGRLAMAWNRLHPEGTTDDSLRRSGVFTQRKASWFRAELSLAFSNDEGTTWTDPVVIARHAKPVGWVAYPYIYEREPGSTMGGRRCWWR